VDENQIAALVLDCAFKIHRQLGPGLFESVYETLLEYELTKLGLDVARQQALPVIYEGIKLEHGFRIDLVVNGRVLVEVKSLEGLAPLHYKQILTYLRLTDLRLGLLINFNVAALKDGIKRVANQMPPSLVADRGGVA
jgi:GxxExxY protein